MLLTAECSLCRQQELMRLHAEHQDLADRHLGKMLKAGARMGAARKKLGVLDEFIAWEVSLCTLFLGLGLQLPILLLTRCSHIAACSTSSSSDTESLLCAG